MKLPLTVAAVSGLVALTLLNTPPATGRFATPADHAAPPSSPTRQQPTAEPPTLPDPTPVAPRLALHRPAFSPVHQAMLENFTTPPAHETTPSSQTSLQQPPVDPSTTTQPSRAISQLAATSPDTGGQPLGDLPPLPPAICFAPGTDPTLMDALWAASARSYQTSTGLDPFTIKAFQLANRWSRTATNRFSSNSQGEPVTLTWGFLPDGVVIPGGNQGSGEASSASDLRSWLNNNWGTHPTSTDPRDQPWFPLFADTFTRWSEVAGVHYVYEPDDDRASFPSSRGSSGTRPDVRIGGHRIDGFGDTLAYNFYPNVGDMVIDTSDSFLESKSKNSINLRNTIAHEHGHGLGLEHVCPVDRSKLMEPNLSSTFDGPQFDDIYSANRHYGDRLEDVTNGSNPDDNNGSADATDLGLLRLGTTSFTNLSIDDNSDRDYFKYELPSDDVTYTVSVIPQGPTYNEAAQNSDNSCSPGTPFASADVHDLAMQLRRANRSTVFMSVNETTTGQPESAENITPPDGAGPYWMRVTPESSTNRTQLYTLQFEITGPPPPSAIIAGNTANESDGQVTFTVTLNEPAPLEGSVSYLTISGTATSSDDFPTTSGTLTFSPGESEKTIAVPIVEDGLDEEDETFVLALSNPQNLALNTTAAVATIIDNDDPPTLELLLTASETTETGTPVTVNFALSTPSGRTLSFEIANTGGTATPGTDFTSPTGSAIFDPGITSAPIEITILPDDLPEPDETIAFTLTDPINVTLPTTAPLLTIIDDDAPRLLSTTDAQLTADAGSVTLTWTAAPGRLYNIEVSDDLLVWLPHPSNPTVTPGSTSAAITIPTTHNFLRLTTP